MSKKVEIVLNKCYGGFSLSDEAILLYANLRGISLDVVRDKWGGLGFKNTETGEYFYSSELDRTDPNLVKVVKTLGEKASGECAQLEIDYVYLTDLNDLIESYDGYESIK